MSRPSPQSEPTDLARTMREICAHMLEDAAAAGLLAPLYLLIARAIAGLFGRLADIAELWKAGALPPPPPITPRLPAPRAGTRPNRARHNRARRAVRAPNGVRAIARPRFTLPCAAAAFPRAPRASRPVERYPKP